MRKLDVPLRLLGSKPPLRSCWKLPGPGLGSPESPVSVAVYYRIFRNVIVKYSIISIPYYPVVDNGTMIAYPLVVVEASAYWGDKPDLKDS